MDFKKVAIGYPCSSYLVEKINTIDSLWYYCKIFTKTAKERGMAASDILTHLTGTLSNLPLCLDFKCPDFSAYGRTPEDICTYLIQNPSVPAAKNCGTYYRTIDSHTSACRLCKHSKLYRNSREDLEYAILKYMLSSEENLSFVADYVKEDFFESCMDVSMAIPVPKAYILPMPKILVQSLLKNNIRLLLFSDLRNNFMVNGEPFDMVWEDAYATFPKNRKIPVNLSNNPMWQNALKTEVRSRIANAEDFTKEQLRDLFYNILLEGDELSAKKDKSKKAETKKPSPYKELSIEDVVIDTATNQPVPKTSLTKVTKEISRPIEQTSKNKEKETTKSKQPHPSFQEPNPAIVRLEEAPLEQKEALRIQSEQALGNTLEKEEKNISSKEERKEALAKPLEEEQEEELPFGLANETKEEQEETLEEEDADEFFPEVEELSEKGSEEDIPDTEDISYEIPSEEVSSEASITETEERKEDGLQAILGNLSEGKEVSLMKNTSLVEEVQENTELYEEEEDFISEEALLEINTMNMILLPTLVSTFHHKKVIVLKKNASLPSSFYHGVLREKKMFVEVVRSETGAYRYLLWSKHMKKFLLINIEDSSEDLKKLFSYRSIEKICHTPYVLYGVNKLFKLPIRNIFSLQSVHGRLFPNDERIYYNDFCKAYGNEILPKGGETTSAFPFSFESKVPMQCPFLCGMPTYDTIHHILLTMMEESGIYNMFIKDAYLDEALGSSYFYGLNFMDKGVLLLLIGNNRIFFRKEFQRQKITEGRYISYYVKEKTNALAVFQFLLQRLAEKGLFRTCNIQVLGMDRQNLHFFIAKQQEEYLLSVIDLLLFEYGKGYLNKEFEILCFKSDK